MMNLNWRYCVCWLLAPVFVILAGCNGGVLPSAPSDPRMQDLFSLLRLDDDVEEIIQVADPQVACIEPGDPATKVHQDLFNALNEYRIQNGLQPLLYSKRLEAAGQAHLMDMCDRDYFAHITPEGLKPGDRAMENGFCHDYVGENLAAGQRTVKRVMLAWERSPSHQLNMVEAKYVYVGVAHYVNPVTGRQYWAQEFAYALE